MTTGIHTVRLGYVRSYIVDGDEGVVLVDTGLPRKEDQIAQKLASIGRAVTDIRAILLTHSHTDHVGSAAALKALSGAEVSVSPADAPAARGEEAPPLPAMFSGILRPIGRLLPGPPPVEVDHLISEADQTTLPTDITVVDSPGHTPGHICFLVDRGGGTLLAGDAAVADRRGAVARGFMNRRGPEWDASIRHIAEHDFSEARFGHSGPIREHAADAFRRFAAEL